MADRPLRGLARQSVANAIATGSVLLSGALSTIIVARLLGPADLGVVVYAAWIVSIVLILVDLGIPGALARYLPELRETGDVSACHGLTHYVYKRFILAVGLAAVTISGLALWYFFTDPKPSIEINSASYSTAPVFWLLISIAILTQSSTAFAIGMLRGQQAFGKMARIMLVAAATQIGATIVGSFTFGVTGALSAAVVVGIAPTIFLLREIRIGSAVDSGLRTRLIRYCSTTWLVYILSAFTWARIEILFLERSWGSEAVALFSIGLTLANLAVQAPLLLIGPLLPVLAQHIAAKEHTLAVETCQTAMRYLAILIFPACFGLAAIAPVFVPLVYGPAFTEAVMPAVMLIIAAAFYALTAVTQSFLNAVERNRVSVLIGVAGASTIVFSGLIIIPSHGLMAAAFTRTSVQVFTTIVLIWYMHRYLNAPAPLSQIARIVCAAGSCGLTAFGILQLVAGPGALAPAILAGIIVYVIALKLFGCILSDDVKRLRSLRGPRENIDSK